ncbi:hypothetical protein JST97_15805 [bacterium]|nr:hypothetical protein [bacterium]
MNRILGELLAASVVAVVIVTLYVLSCGAGGLFLFFGGFFSPEATRSVTQMYQFPIGKLGVSAAVCTFLALEGCYQLVRLGKQIPQLEPIAVPDAPKRYSAQIPDTPTGLRLYARKSEHALNAQQDRALLTGDRDFDRFFWVEGPEHAKDYLNPARRNLLLRMWTEMPEAVWESGRVEGQLSLPSGLQKRVELLKKLARELAALAEGAQSTADA